jgi:hypothetical protein
MRIDGLILPVYCAGFEVGSVIDNELGNPGLGHTIAYHGGALGESAVYVYDRGLIDIPENPMSEIVRHEFAIAIQDVLSAQTPDKRVTLIERYGTGSPDRGLEFLCAEFILTDEAGERRTLLYVTGAQSRFVKVRITLRTNDATDPTARNFVDALAATLRRSQESAAGDRLH